jgi:anti-anti-sigma factor
MTWSPRVSEFADAARPTSPPRPARRGRSRSWSCPRPSRFGILVVPTRDDVILQLGGILDREGSAAFDACVKAAVSERPRRLVLELSALVSIDDDGVRCLAQTSRAAADVGVDLVLDSPSPMVLHALECARSGMTFSVR